MLLVYMSLTGNVQSFVERTEMDSLELTSLNPHIEVSEHYILVLPTYVGYVNYDVEQFIEYAENEKYLIGFAASGNMNFNDTYCINGKELSEQYNKPLIFTFEYSGTNTDIENFKKEVANIGITKTK